MCPVFVLSLPSQLFVAPPAQSRHSAPEGNNSSLFLAQDGFFTGLMPFLMLSQYF